MKKSIVGLLGATLFCLMMAASAGAADDGTVITGNLVWLRDGGCLSNANWHVMQGRIKALGHGRCWLSDNSKPGDWRMPTLEEICDHIPALRHNLHELKEHYWTATEGYNDPSKAYIISTTNGGAHVKPKETAYTWGLAVRDKRSRLIGQ